MASAEPGPGAGRHRPGEGSEEAAAAMLGTREPLSQPLPVSSSSPSSPSSLSLSSSSSSLSSSSSSREPRAATAATAAAATTTTASSSPSSPPPPPPPWPDAWPASEARPLLAPAAMSWRRYPRGRFWLIFGQLLAAQFIGCFDGTLMASSHPVITSHFGAARAASWLSTAFLLTSTAVQPLLGRLSDALGRRPLYLGCLLVLAIATAGCALAPTIVSLILARGLCGVGAGGVVTLGSIITSDLIPIEHRGTYQSYVNLVYGAGSALGAALGGAMAEYLGWRWEFAIQLPLIALCFAVAYLVLPPDLGLTDEGKAVWSLLREFDFAGSALLTLSVSFLILGLSVGGNLLSWSHPVVITSLTLFTICFPTFLWAENRSLRPIMPLRLIRRAPRANLILANFIAALIANCILFNIPLYYQAVLLTSATSSGLRLVSLFVVSSLSGAGTGFAITWSRRLKWPIVTGALFFLVGSLALAVLRRHLPSLVYLAVLVPSSLGQGFQFPGTFMAVLATSTQAEQAVVTSTLILWRSLGLVLGVASSSLVVQNALVHYLRAYVDGPDRDYVINRVLASVEAVAQLEQPHRDQVVRSYEAALRLTFACCTVLSVVSVLLVMPVRLPRLASSRL